MSRDEDDLKDATYLGDGLYVAMAHRELELFAHNGIGKTNSVFLDPAVLVKFLIYLKANGVNMENVP